LRYRDGASGSGTAPKLLSTAGSTQSAFLARLPAALGKSFLLLFFKKEGLPSFFYLITAAS
jgi:hypothetical protein